MSGAQSHGICVCAYHFFTLCRPGVEQARNFLAALPVDVDLPPVVDLEFGGNCAARPTRSEFERELSAFVLILTSERGLSSVLYATEEFYKGYVADTFFASSPLWVRDIFARMSWPDGGSDNNGRVVFRQFANNGRVDGIVGPVDLNHFIGSLEEFETAFPPRQ